MKKAYYTPRFFPLTPEDDPGIIIGPSQGSSGYDSQWTFDGVSDEDIDMIDLHCDDFDLKAMDTNEDYVITNDEFQAWYNAHQPW